MPAIQTHCLITVSALSTDPTQASKSPHCERVLANQISRMNPQTRMKFPCITDSGCHRSGFDCESTEGVATP